MTEPHDADALDLQSIAPVDVPVDLFEQMVDVAVDPSTPPVGDDLLPADLPPDTGDDEIDLGDLDDHGAPTGDHSGGDPDGLDPHEVDPHGPSADPADGGAPTDPVDPAVDPVSYTDPFADDPGADPAGHPAYDDAAAAHEDPLPSYDDPGV